MRYAKLAAPGRRAQPSTRPCRHGDSRFTGETEEPTVAISKTFIPRGRDLLRDPRFNRGTAFTAAERSALGLDGLLPPAVLSLEEQASRSYEQYAAQPTDLAKNDFLAALHDRNE